MANATEALQYIADVLDEDARVNNGESYIRAALTDSVGNVIVLLTDGTRAIIDGNAADEEVEEAPAPKAKAKKKSAAKGKAKKKASRGGRGKKAAPVVEEEEDDEEWDEDEELEDEEEYDDEEDVLEVETLAEFVYAVREELGLTQEEASEAAGVSLSTWNKMEKGKGTPRKSTLEKIAEALEVEYEDIEAFL